MMFYRVKVCPEHLWQIYIALPQCVHRHCMVRLGKSTQRPLPDCIGRGLYSYQFNPVLEPLLAVIIPTTMQVHFGLLKTLHTQFGQ